MEASLQNSSVVNSEVEVAVEVDRGAASGADESEPAFVAVVAAAAKAAKSFVKKK